MRGVRWLGVALVCMSLLGFGAKAALDLSNSRSVQVVGDLVTHVRTADSIVALTFDDGPIEPYTDSVLTVLRELQVPATFFSVGRALERRPALAARIVADGHELANHSYSHVRLLLRSPAFIAAEIERTDSVIRSHGHTGPIWVRPPYGKRIFGLPWYLARRDRPVVLWDLEPDTFHNESDGVVRYVVDRVAPGSIILLHVETRTRSENRKALPEIVSELRARGYRFVTLSELMTSGEPARLRE